MQIEAYEKGMVRFYEPLISADCFESNSTQCFCGRYHGFEYVGRAFLPHSCQEWIIGGREQIEVLIADLQEILNAQTTDQTPEKATV